MKVYHYTLKANVQSILTTGLQCGRAVEQGERLNAILVTIRQYEVRTGGYAFLEINLPDHMPHRFVNDEWIEVYQTIPPSAIAALAKPPNDDDELIRLYMSGGMNAVNQAFEYKTIV